MKQLLLTLLTATLIGISANAACVDVSGDYSVNVDPIGRESVISIVQKSCNAIATGFYKFNFQTGLKEEASSMIVTFVNKQYPDLCELGNCVTFEADATKLRFERYGSLPVGNIICSYNQVDWSLVNGDLEQVFTLKDSNPKCQKIQTAKKTLKRFTPPFGE